jgi:hypothetical protein
MPVRIIDAYLFSRYKWARDHPVTTFCDTALTNGILIPSLALFELSRRSLFMYFLVVHVVCTPGERPYTSVCCRACKRRSPLFESRDFNMRGACYVCRLVKLMWGRAGFKEMKEIKTSAVVYQNWAYDPDDEC